mmetsp:Transcript_26351/g.42246  ORF Transcript_26351/g.42246 Transcript_26351/m.42246 type:complete len:159 (+) Transcript_26351:148-624(+)
MVLKCHLIFKTESMGSMFSAWSEEDIPGAMAIWIPNPSKKIPGYLLKKQKELVRNITGNKQAIFKAYTEFAKQAAQYDGTFVNLPETGGLTQNILIYFLTANDEVVETVSNTEYVVNNFAAVAAVREENSIFAGVKTYQKADFLNKPETKGFSSIKLG